MEKENKKKRKWSEIREREREGAFLGRKDIFVSIASKFEGVLCVAFRVSSSSSTIVYTWGF